MPHGIGSAAVPRARTTRLGRPDPTRARRLGDAPEPAWKVTFLERMDVGEGPAVGELVDKGAVEEVDGEAAVLVDVVAVVDARTVMRVGGVPDGVDECSSGSKDSP